MSNRRTASNLLGLPLILVFLFAPYFKAQELVRPEFIGNSLRAIWGTSPVDWVTVTWPGNAITRATFPVLTSPVNGYHNWGTSPGSTGFGIRDKSGTSEFKNNAGQWLPVVASAASAGRWTQVDKVVNTTTGSDIAIAGNINNTRQCNQFAGADAGAKIAACIAALPSTGGTADARGLEGAQAWASCPVTGIAKNVTLSLGAGTAALSVNCTIPSNVTLQLNQGSVLSVNSGLTLTINGGVQASLSQHFSGSGAVSFSGNLQIFPQWWGATGDGSTDDSAAVQLAATAAAGSALYFPATPQSYKFGNVVLLSNTRVVFAPNATVKVKSGTNAFTITGSATLPVAINNTMLGNRLIVTTGTNTFTAGDLLRISGTPTAPINGVGPFVQIGQVTSLSGTTANLNIQLYSSMTGVTAAKVTPISDVIIEDMRAVAESASSIGILATNSDKNTQVIRPRTTGLGIGASAGVITLVDSYGSFIIDGVFDDVSGIGLYLYACSNIKVLRNRIIQNTPAAFSSLLYAASPIDLEINGNFLSRTPYDGVAAGNKTVDGLLLNGTNVVGNAGNRIIGNTIINGGQGYAGNGRGGIMSLYGAYNLFDGNSSTGSDFGIYLSTETRFNRIVNNITNYNGGTFGYYGDGIEFDVGAYDNIITGNESSHNTGSSEGDGIQLRSNGARNIISGNITSNNSGNGINIQSGTINDLPYTIITGNIATSNGAYGISFRSSNQTVANNIVIGNSSGAISAITDSTVFNSNNLGYNPQGLSVGTPAFPGSTASSCNNTPQDVQVYLWAGTITSVVLDGTSQIWGGGTLGNMTFLLQNSHCVAITYTGTPQWRWWGL